MLRIFGFVFCFASFVGLPAGAQDRVTLGWGRMFSNDALGDGHDRWRTGGYQLSLLRGVSFSGQLPQTPGDLLEFRAASQIIAPGSLTKAALGDRRYAGILSFGLHTIFDWQGNDVSLGGDLVFVGPQTGVGRFQKWIHQILDLPAPKVVSHQIGDGLYPSLLAEVGRQIPIAPDVTLRPFVEAQVGAERLVRVGGDLVIGTLGQGAIMTRDTVTGQRYRLVETDHNLGYSFVMGGDFSQVAESVFLPAGGPAVLRAERNRLRAGVHWQGQKSSAFYGVSYLSREFETQPEGQFVGGLSLSLKF